MCCTALAHGQVQMPDCRKDIRRFCAEIPNELFWIEKCLQKNQGFLSPECRTASGQSILWFAGFADYCIHERQKFCPKVPAEKQALIQCLSESLNGIAPPCREFIGHE